MSFLIVDIDNVVCDFVTAMTDFVNDKMGTEYSPSDVTVWDFVESPNIDIEFDKMMSMLDEFFAMDLWRNIPIYEESKDVLDWISENHKFIYLTNRPPNAESATTDYFDRHELPYTGTHILQSYDDEVSSGDIVFINGHKKSYFAHNIPDVVAIDDKPMAVQEYLDMGVPCALKVEPYNHWVDYKDPSNLLTRCENLSAFKDWVISMEND